STIDPLGTFGRHRHDVSFTVEGNADLAKLLSFGRIGRIDTRRVVIVRVAVRRVRGIGGVRVVGLVGRIGRVVVDVLRGGRRGLLHGSVLRRHRCGFVGRVGRVGVRRVGGIRGVGGAVVAVARRVRRVGRVGGVGTG